MAGRPIIRKQMKILDDFGEENLLALVEQGMTTREIYETFGVGRRAYYAWLNKNDRIEKFDQARKVYAESLDKESLEIADNVPPDREHVSKAKLQIQARRWVAENADRSRKSKQEAGTVINIGSLHLEALRNRMGGGMIPADTSEDEGDEDIQEAEWEELED